MHVIGQPFHFDRLDASAVVSEYAYERNMKQSQ